MLLLLHLHLLIELASDVLELATQLEPKVRYQRVDLFFYGLAYVPVLEMIEEVADRVQVVQL